MTLQINSLSSSWIRAQFPALQHDDTVYLDNAAGSQVPQQVVDNMVEALSTMQVNKGGYYKQSQRITEIKESVRERVSVFLNAASPQNVAFGPNATTLIELLAQAVGRSLKAGDEIIVSGLDHHANVDPWRRLSERGLLVKTWPLTDPTRSLDVNDLAPLITERTRVVAVTAASNALGTLSNIPEVAKVVHDAGAKLMVDAVHYAPHFLPDVQQMQADMLVFSPYKVFGPHLGVLYLSDEMREMLRGPGLSFFPASEPINWEPGTQNHEAIHAFGGVFSYLDAVAESIGQTGASRERWQSVYDAFQQHETALFERLLTGLQDLGADCYGLPDAAGRTATVSLNMPDVSPDHLAHYLGQCGIAVANGHYYAYGLMMDILGLRERGGAVRLSLLHYNSEEDVARVLAALSKL